MFRLLLRPFDADDRYGSEREIRLAMRENALGLAERRPASAA